MDLISDGIDFVLHLDEHLHAVAQQYGPWIYLLLFLIVFCETGLVVTPILPGDSLLFAVGSLAAGGSLDIWLLLVLLIVAAVLGDAVNYACGAFIGPKVFRQETGWLLNRKYLDRTHRFYERHGGKTIILARFVPIVRTFAPFVAGVGRMSYPRFAVYNVTGAIVWVGLFLWAGYAFGHLPLVRDNFTLVILGIIVVSILPAVFEYARAKLKPEPTTQAE